MHGPSLGAMLALFSICVLARPLPLHSQIVERANVTENGEDDPVGADNGGVGLGGALDISRDGRVVLFASKGALSPIDQNSTGGFDYYVRDRLARRTTLVSSSASTPVQVPEASLSAGGGVVAFIDAVGPASGLPLPFAVFVRRVGGESQNRADIGPKGQPAVHLAREVHLSADGNFLVFDAGFFGSLTGEPTQEFTSGIFRRNLATGVTEEFETVGVFGRPYPYPLAVSDDAETVVYYASLLEFPPGLMVKKGAGEIPRFVPGNQSAVALSGDGRFLAFHELSQGVLLLDLDGDPEPRLVRPIPQNVPHPHTLSLSADGRFLAFTTPEAIDPRDTIPFRLDAYRWNREQDEFFLLSATPQGTGARVDVVELALAGDGSTAAFALATRNFAADVFVAVAGFLHVTLEGPQQVFVGERGRYRAAVTNRSPFVARNVTLAVAREVAALSIFSEPEPGQGVCRNDASDLLACDLGDLAPGGSASVDFALLSLGVETVPFTAFAIADIEGEETESDDATLTVDFNRCKVTFFGEERGVFGQEVQLLAFFNGPGEGDVEFDFSLEEPGGIVQRERISPTDMIISVVAIERPGEVIVRVRATRAGCSSETDHRIFFALPSVPVRSDFNPQEPASDDSDATAIQKTPPCSVFLHNGENRHDRTDLAIPGRGDLHFVFTRRYRSQIRFDGPLGHGWDFNYNEKLVEKPDGDVIRVNGRSHVDLWVRNNDGSYTSPRGFFGLLRKRGNGSFVLREPDGFKRFYDSSGRLVAHEDRNQNRLSFEYGEDGHLRTIIDPFGRLIDFAFEAGRLARIRDFSGREVLYSYDENDDLIAVRTPVVTGTSTGNDFPIGRTERYTYSSGFENEDLNHNLVAVIHPEEEATGGPPAMTWTYGNDPSDPLTFDRVLTQTEGGTNASGIEAGGTSSFAYDALNAAVPAGELSVPRLRTTVVDRKGNVEEHFFNERSQHILARELTRGLREGEPEAFETRYEYDEDDQIVRVVWPEGNESFYAYDRFGARGSQKNVVEIRRVADSARGGGEDLLTTMTYEPLYNRLASVTDPRGNSASFEPPLGMPMAGRFTWRFFYDYQEGTGPVPEATEFGLDLSNVARGFGDLNGDGRVDQTAGNWVRTAAPSVILLPESKEAMRLGRDIQEIIVEAQWNERGQMLAEIDPEGNVVTRSYYPAGDPDGDGSLVAGGMNEGGGYLRSLTIDARGSPRRLETAPPAVLETVFRYDPVGNLIAIRNPRGIVTQLEVNALNEPVVITRGAEVADAIAAGELLTNEEPFRYRVRISHDHDGRRVKVEVENRDSNTPGVGEFVDFSFAYDILDNLIERTAEVDAETTLVWQTRYDPNELPTLFIEPEGNRQSITYDERDLPFLITRGEGSPDESTSRIDYDPNGNAARTIDAEDSDGDGEPEAVHIIYDGFDRPREIIDPLGNRIVNQYDPESNLVRRQVFGHPPNQLPTGRGGVSPEVLLADVFFVQDELDRTYEANEALFLSEGFETDRPVELEDENGDGFVTTRVEYDRSSRLTFTVEDDGEVSETIYDGVGRAVERRDAEGNRTICDFDRSSNVIRRVEIERATDDLVAEESFETIAVYDQLDRLIRLTDNVGQTTRFSYDSRDNRVAATDPVGESIADPLGLFSGEINGPGNSTSWVYDGLGRLVREVRDLREGGRGERPLDFGNAQNPDGQVALSYRWDGNSRLVEVADDNANKTSFRYDALDRRTVKRYADGTEFTLSYDRDDNIARIVDPNGSVTTSTYDALDRLIERRIERAPGVEGTTHETFSYDGLNRLTRRTDDNGAADVFHQIDSVYDSLSRLVEEAQSVGVAAVTEDGFVRGDCNGDGSTGGVTDAIFLLGFTFLGTASPPCREACDTNGDGSLSGVSDAIYLLSFNFLGATPPPAPFPSCGRTERRLGCESGRACGGDGAGGVPAGRRGVVSSVWAGDGKRLRQTYPGGRNIAHTFDSIDRISTTSDDSGTIVESFWIGPEHRELLRLAGNGTRSSLLDDSGTVDTGSDALRRTVRSRAFLPGGAGVFLDREYEYNRANMRTAIRRRDDFALVDRFSYDSVYRIVATDLDGEGAPGAVRRTEVGIEYGLDGVGNRRQVTVEGSSGAGAERLFTVNEVNEYAAVDSQARSYDANGNLKDDGSRLFSYDFKNRLTRVADKISGRAIAEYTYHGDNRRARKVVFDPRGAGEVSEETLFFYDGWQVCEEVDASSGETRTTYVWSPTHIDDLVELERSSAHPRGAGRFFAHQDDTGAVVALTSGAGALVEKRFFDDYGNAFDEEKSPVLRSTIGNPYGFQGRRLDPETGLYYFRNRTYDPALGRFLQRDPLADDFNLENQYTFAGNNPVSRGDPSGLISFESSDEYSPFDLTTGGPFTWFLDSLVLDPPPPPRKRTEGGAKPPQPESPVPGKGGLSEHGLFAPYQLNSREEVLAACRMLATVDLVLLLLDAAGAPAQARQAFSSFPRASMARGATRSEARFGGPHGGTRLSVSDTIVEVDGFHVRVRDVKISPRERVRFQRRHARTIAQLEAGGLVDVPQGQGTGTFQRMAEITAGTGRETGLFRLRDGRRILVMGTRTGIEHVPGDVHRMIAHTHPSGHLSFSAGDVQTLATLGRRRMTIVGPERGQKSSILISPTGQSVRRRVYD